MLTSIRHPSPSLSPPAGPGPNPWVALPVLLAGTFMIVLDS